MEPLRNAVQVKASTVRLCLPRRVSRKIGHGFKYSNRLLGHSTPRYPYEAIALSKLPELTFVNVKIAQIMHSVG